MKFLPLDSFFPPTTGAVLHPRGHVQWCWGPFCHKSGAGTTGISEADARDIACDRPPWQTALAPKSPGPGLKNPNLDVSHISIPLFLQEAPVYWCYSVSLKAYTIYQRDDTHREFFINAVSTSRKPQMKTSTGRTGSYRIFTKWTVTLSEQESHTQQYARLSIMMNEEKVLEDYVQHDSPFTKVKNKYCLGRPS